MCFSIDDNLYVVLAEKHVVFITEISHLNVTSCGDSYHENLNSIKT